MSPLWVGLAFAHPATPSTLTLDVGRQQVAMDLRIPRDQLEMALSGEATWHPELPAPSDALVVPYVLANLGLTSGGEPLPLQLDGLTWTEVDGEPFVELSLTARSGDPLGSLVLHDSAVAERVRSHRTWVVLRGDVGAGVDVEPRMVGMVNGVRRELAIPAGGASRGMVALAAFRDGITHIAGGFDHMVFLWELLVAVPLVARGGRWSVSTEGVARRLFGLLTAFTLAHSATLVLVALGLVHVPGTLVESWVALSVLVAGLHLWRPLWPGREGLFAAAAGLVHGAAFAEGLLGSGLSAGELALPLVAFNGGIEVAQGALALGTLPLWMTVASRPALRRAVAGAGVLAGLGWLVSLWS